MGTYLKCLDIKKKRRLSSVVHGLAYNVKWYLQENPRQNLTSAHNEMFETSLWENMFLFGEVSSSSGCLRWATLFYCGTP